MQMERVSRDGFGGHARERLPLRFLWLRGLHAANHPEVWLKALVFCTGPYPRKLDCPGASKLWCSSPLRFRLALWVPPGSKVEGQSTRMIAW